MHRRAWKSETTLSHKIPEVAVRGKMTKFDPLVLKKLKMLARKRGVSYNAYIRLLLAKGVEKEIIQAAK
jgi:hypothetical protein